MPSADHVLGWYAAMLCVAIAALILTSLLFGCGDPVSNPVSNPATYRAGLIPCWTGDVHRDTIWITPAEVWGIECYCTLPAGIDPADYRPAEPS